MKGGSCSKIKRRSFLKAGIAAVALGGCASREGQGGRKLPEPTAAQLAWKRKDPSAVAIVPCASYEENPLQLLKEYAKELELPDLTGKRVLLKPNMVEFRPGLPITTNPIVLRSAVELVDYLGASEIIIGEGPGHMRDTEFLLESTGLGGMVKKLGLQFVDLNLDELEKVENKNGFSGLENIYLPKTLMHADAVVSVPKMKTHHWVGMTASMKNLFGTVPGRKYGWPKNLLHIKGIPQCILDLVHLIHPVFAVVDGVVAMEGDGPVNGVAKKTGFIVLGNDLAAIDATCARTMSIDPYELDYIKMAGKVIGNIEKEKITIHGSAIEKVCQEFDRPITFKNKDLLAQSANQAS